MPKYLGLLHASEDSEAEVMPDPEMFVKMGALMEEVTRAGVLLGTDGRDQRPGPFDDRLRRQVRLRDGDFLGSHLGMP